MIYGHFSKELVNSDIIRTKITIMARNPDRTMVSSEKNSPKHLKLDNYIPTTMI